MPRHSLRLAAQAAVLLAASALVSPALAAPKVIVSIKPLHSLVASLMKGVGEPALIVDGAASPHTYQMKPSQAQALSEADLVFWTGGELEHFLEKPLETLGANANVVALAKADGVKTLPVREGGALDAHEHEGEEGHDDHAHENEGHDDKAHDDHAHDNEGQDEAGHDDHAHEGEADLHVWLDPHNARAMAKAAAAALMAADPANKSLYTTNLGALDAELTALEGEIATTLAPVKDRPVIVFHDAFQYFENRFGVRVAGSITVSPETMPGAKRLSDIRAKIETLGATCVFAEPQFEPAMVKTLVEGTKARTGVLDPEGGALEAGPGLYPALLRGIAGNLAGCLKGE